MKSFKSAGNGLLLAGIVLGLACGLVIAQQTDVDAPYVQNLNPAENETQVPIDTNICFHLLDDGEGVNNATVSMSVQLGNETAADIIINGTTQVPADYPNSVQWAGTPGNYTICYDPPDYDIDNGADDYENESDPYRFGYNQTVTVRINASDLANNTMSEKVYSFTTQEMLMPDDVKVNDNGTDLDQENSCMVMAKSGKNVYVVWQDEDGDIWFDESADWGETFGEDKKISTNGSGTNEHPRLAVDEPGNVYVVWQRRSGLQGAESYDIYFARKLKNENSFTVDKVPVDDLAAFGDDSDQMHPAIDALNNGDVIIVWANRNGNDGVYYALSGDRGTNFWGSTFDAERIDDDTTSEPEYPVVKMLNSKDAKLFAWSAKESGKRKIYFSAIYREGNNVYTLRDQVSDDALDGDSNKPKIANRSSVMNQGSKKNVVIAWERTDNGNTDIFCDRYGYSRDAGTWVWGTDAELGDADAQRKDPDVAMDSNGDVFAAWSEKTDGDDWDVFAAYSLNNGATFSEKVQMNDGEANDQTQPSLYISGSGKIFATTWTDARNGDSDIYFNSNTVIDETDDYDEVADDDVTTVVEADQQSGVAGTQVEIPSGALEVPLRIQIANVFSVPEFNPPGASLNKFLHFGPSGTRFKQKVTIRIPYTQQELNRVMVTNAGNLLIYYFNLKTGKWEQVTDYYVDTARNLVCARLDHFSTYAVAASEGSSASGDGGGGGGGCFIATAAYGSADAGDVRVLQAFRDKYLLKHGWGKAFVKFYYRHSPAIAAYIAQRPAAKTLVRWSLKPLVKTLKLKGRPSLL